ncbi:hypothetical protein ACKKBF_B39155 [Auxenochlorella protothecoides x Auxenochlorella symbiontica]
MGMLGHEHRPPPAISPGGGPQGDAAPEVDEEQRKRTLLQQELGILDLTNPEIPLERQVELLTTSIKERLEGAVNTPMSPVVVGALFPALMQVLGRHPADLSLPLDAPASRLRTAAVDLLGRLSIPELPKSFVADLLSACHAVLMTDHEANGMVVQRIMYDVHKIYKLSLEDQSIPFFEWLKQLYESMPAAYERFIGSRLEDLGPAGSTPPLVPARASFKLAAEVAVFVVFLLQSYPKRMHQYAAPLIPVIVAAAGIRGPDPGATPPALAGAVYDLRMAQIKMLAFLTVMARPANLQAAMLEHRDAVCAALVRVMTTVPEVAGIRKELMIAVRNLLATKLRPGLLASMDVLLDERVLMGTSRACIESVRPLACSTLAELVASVKAEMSLPQLTTIVDIFVRNTNDCTAPAALQSTSMRLLYNLIETIFQRRSESSSTSEEYRNLLSRILDCFVCRLRVLKEHAPRFAEEATAMVAAQAAKAAEASASEAKARRIVQAKRKQQERRAAAAEAAAAAAAAEVTPPAMGDGDDQPTAAAPGGGPAPGGEVADNDGDVKMEEAGVTPALGSTADPGSTAPPAAPATTAAPAATAGADAREPMEVDEGAVKEEEAGEPASAEATQASVQAPEDGSDAAPGEATGDAADDARIDAEFDALRQNAYKPLIPTMASVPGKDKELQEYKGLLQTVLSCLKSVLYTLVAFHSNRGLATPLSFPVEPWSSRPGDLAVVSRILAAGLPTLALYRAWPAAAAADMREQFADLFTVLQDGRDFCDVLAPRLPALFDAVAADAWYLPVVRHLVDGDQAARAGVNRHMVVALLRHLVGERLGALGEPGSAEGALAAQLLEACFEALPRMQAADAAKAAQVPPAPAAGGGIEDAVLPHVLAFTQHVYARLSLDGPDAEVHMRLLRSLFFALATGKFLKVQAAFGHTGLHVRVIDLTLGMMAGPTPSPAAGELCAELCLLAPARLEHLIPVMPRLAAALVTALKGSDRAASVALRVLDVWVDSFNPEFIEKSMAAHIRPLMQALWSLIRPPPAPFGARVAEILGKMGGRSRRWLLDPAQVAHKAIPEYGLRVILGFQAHTSFLVPLDRSMHYALGALAAGEPHLRAAALRLLHLCVATLARLRLPPAAAGDPRLAPRLLQRALFAPGAEPPALPADAHWPAELGVKTKKQHAAERAMLETLLVAAMTAPAVPDALQAEAAAFARGVARHFALLFAAGWGAQTPPPAPPSSRHERYAALGGVPAAVATLTHLHPHLLLDAFHAGLASPDARDRDAIVDCMREFLDTLLAVGRAQGGGRPRPGDDEADSGAGGREAGASGSGERAPAGQPARGGAAAGPQLAADPSRDGAASPPGVTSPPPPPQPPRYVNVVHDLVMRCVHCCYGETWAHRLGGIAGLQLLASRMPAATLQRPAVPLLRAVLAVLRTLPTHAAGQRRAITRVLTFVLRRCLGLPVGDGEEEGGGGAVREGEGSEGATATTAAPAPRPGAERAALVRSLVETVIRELVSSKSNDAVRAGAAECLGVLAQAQGSTVSEVLGSMMDRLAGISDRRLLPLRAINAQTSYAHSIAFVIEHCPEQLPLTQEVVSFLADACTIMETDMAKVTARVTVRGQPPRAEVVGKLQVACVEVLVAALGWRAFREPEGPEAVQRTPAGEVRTTLPKLRERITKVFITELGSPNERVVELSAQGVRLSIKHSIMQKPILTDLAFYHKLTLQLLTHLHHLLDLLSGQFNVTLGEKITEHLKKWVDAEKWISPQPPQPVAWEPGTECEVAASMLDIFHKLPAQAKRFLESQGDRPGIVVLTIGLENALPKLPGPLQPSRLTSPYRPALTRFLNVYPQDTVDYFLDVSGRLANAEYFRRLLDVIRTPLGRPILDALAGQATRLALLVRPEASGGADGVAGEAAPVPLEAALHVVHLVRAMIKLLPDWLPHELYAVLLARWRSPGRLERAENGCGTSRAAERESRRLGKCLLAYVNAHHEEYAALFDLLTILSTKPSVDFGFVKEYLTTTVAKTYNTEEKRTILVHWIKLYKERALSPDDQVNALRHFINPLMKWTLASEGPGILTKDIVSSLVADVFQTPDQGRPSEQAQQELNMLCSTLIQHAHTLFVDHRKELIHFGWWALKFDNVAKPSAFLFLAHFLRVFPTPEKIMLQVYVALARMTQQESAARDVVRQAVDTLLPIFNAGRAPGQEPETPPSGDASLVPLALAPRTTSGVGGPAGAGAAAPHARYLRRVLLEDGHIPATLAHIFSLIVRNHDLFYSSRTAFMASMVQNASKLGLPTNATLEARILATDMAAVLLSWDARAEAEAAAAAADGVPAATEGATATAEGSAAAASSAAVALLAPQASGEKEGSGTPPEGTEAVTGDGSAGQAPASRAALVAAAASARDAGRLTPGSSEVLVNFLLRMAFVSAGSEGRERDDAGFRRLHAHCLDIIRDVATFRPAVTLKLQYFEKVLTGNLQQHQQAIANAAAAGAPPPLHEAPPVLLTGLQIADIYMKTQPANFVACGANQLALMLEPALTCRQSRKPATLLASCIGELVQRYPTRGTAPLDPTAELAYKLLARTNEVLHRFLAALSNSSQQLVPELFVYASNCLLVMKAAVEARPNSMQPLIGPLLAAMHRVAKDHNQQPAAGILGSKSFPPSTEPADSEYGTGAWFMWHALAVAVPSALVLSADYRKHFLSTLVMLITGPSVRNGQTAACIIFAVVNLMEGWLLPPPTTGPGSAEPRPQPQLTSKEPLVFLQRLAQMDRLHAIPASLKSKWDKKFLDLLYTVITDKKDTSFGLELFVRVERTFCCGLQASDPETREKFFRLYAERVPADLFERLRYVIQVQDWDFLAHTYWLKHGVALLFDCAHKDDAITLAYNSAHVPSLLEPNSTLPGSAAAAAAAGTGGTGPSGGGAAGTGAGAGAAVKREPGEQDAAVGTRSGEGPASLAADPASPVGPGSGPSTAIGASEIVGVVVPAGDGAVPGAQSGDAAAPTARATPADAAAASARAPSPPEMDVALPEDLRELLTEHLEFLGARGAVQSDLLVSCLCEVVQGVPAAANHLWGLLFPIVWTSLAKEQQTALAKPIIQLLSKEHHVRQVALRPTVGQTLLEGISMSQPQPKIPAEMIKYMGRHFHAWQTAISMLESHVTLFPQDMRCFDAVCELYRAVGEDDMVAGLWQRRAACEDTRLALALQQHGYLAQAQDKFLELMSRGVSTGVPGATKSEMVLWQRRYLDCCAELNQWDVVGEYAKATENSALSLEAGAHLHDWAHLRAAVLPRAQLEESAEVSMVRAQVALTEPMQEVDRLCKQALAQCVARWWQMPEASPWALAPVLHAFQRAVELPESWRIMMEFVRKGGPSQQYQELKDICETWKLRTPNEWEPVRWWSDLLTWRNQIHDTSITQLNNPQAIAANLHQMGYRDKAWSVNRLGLVARLHSQPDACCAIINTMYGFTAMEVQEAFVKVREQAKAYLMKPDTHLHGLNLINSTNLDYFQPQHQAEMINLKAQFLAALGEGDAADATFSEALTLWTLCPDAWIAWGRFCDARQAAGAGASWLEFAAACYTQAIRLGGLEARSLVPRLLDLLMVSGGGAEVVGRTLAEAAGDLPAWVWLPWLPQLLVSLQRPELAAARRVLCVAAAAHPQLVYWHARPALHALKEAAVKAVQVAKAARREAGSLEPASGAAAGGATEDGKASEGAAEGEGTPAAAAAAAAAAPGADGGGAPENSPPIEKPMEVLAYDALKEVIDVLKRRFGGPLQGLENLMQELSVRFTNRTDERLLAVVHALGQRTYKTGLPPSAPIPETFKKELVNVCRACSARDGAGPSRSNQYHQQFAKDVDPASPSSPQTLGALTERLKGWRVMLEAVIEDTYPTHLKLENEAPLLLDLALDDVEMPGQAPASLDSPEPVFIERVASTLEVVRRNCNSFRRLTLYGSDGQPRHFLIQAQQQQLTGSDERILAMLRAANVLLTMHPESRRRSLQFSTPAILPIWLGVRIVEDDPTSLSFLDVYENHCARYGREPDDPIVAFKARCCSAEGITTNLEVRLSAYEEVASKVVTENILSQHMHKTMIDPKMTWIVKKQFAQSAAMSAVQCYMLLLTGRSPGRVLVSKSTGRISQMELGSNYDVHFQLEKGHETVPFRLTRNMVAFMGVHGLEGLFVAAAAAAAQGLQAPHSPLASLLALFLRDDILAWAARRSGSRSVAALSSSFGPAQIQTCVAMNVKAATERVAAVGPASSVLAAANPQTGMRKLVDAATNPQNLCRMEPTWQPWF